jgi:D-alanyl-D-alanine dipeptidase
MKFLVACLIFILAMAAACLSFAQENIPLVDIHSVDPTIAIELRYSGTRNIAHRALYPPHTRAMTRPEVARRLAIAQQLLRRSNYALKIWDAYRPKSIQVQLREAARNNDYVANPHAGAGSLHAWGLAVDATLTDKWDRPVAMPTDFDDFTPAAMWKYQGRDPAIREHLNLLQVTMRKAGFYGLRAEWWHFTIDNWQTFLPQDELKRALETMGLD